MISFDLFNLFLIIVISFHLFEIICNSFFLKEPFFWDDEPTVTTRQKRSTDDDDDDDAFWGNTSGVPVWAVILIVTIILGSVGFVLFRRSRKKKNELSTEVEEAIVAEAVAEEVVVPAPAKVGGSSMSAIESIINFGKYLIL